MFHVDISCLTEGASIGYRLKEQGDNAYSSWRIYTGPFTVREGFTIRAQAIRYGYKPSLFAELHIP